MGFWNLPMPKEFAKTFTVIQHIVPSPCFWSLSAVGVVVVFNICMWLCCFVLYVGEEGKGVSHLLPTVTSLGWLHACLYFTSFRCNDSACTMYLFVNPQFQSEPMLKKKILTLLFLLWFGIQEYCSDPCLRSLSTTFIFLSPTLIPKLGQAPNLPSKVQPSNPV